MTISATTQGLRQGVCTSSNRPVTPFEGQMIYETDTDLTYIYGGSAWQQVSGGTAVGNSGLVYVAGASFSAVTEILLDSVFTSTYRNYRFIFDCRSSAGGNIFTWQVRSAGSTISTATYRYQTLNISAGTVTGGNASGAGSMRIGANDTSAYHAMTMDIFCPQIAQPTRTISAFNRDSGLTVENVWGSHTESTSYDGMRIAVASGTMTGSYALYGCRNS